MIKRKQADPESPVIIGGLGGSGTRVFAEILKEIGFYIGNDLNVALDNLWFTLLFKRPNWYKKQIIREKPDVKNTLGLHRKIMLGKPGISALDLSRLLPAVLQWSFQGNHFGGIGGSGKGIWPFQRLLNIMVKREKVDGQYIGWGWKEPNSHVFLPDLNSYYSKMKYIHVIRHGLDMVYSRNLAQLHGWGSLYDVAIKENTEPNHNEALSFWVKANNAVIRYGETKLKERFLMIRFEEFCTEPVVGLRKMLQFLDVDVDDNLFDRLAELPKLPKTTGRFKDKDLNVFNPRELEAMENLGYTV